MTHESLSGMLYEPASLFKMQETTPLYNVNAGFGQLRILQEAMALLPNELKESKMKALRFHVIQLPGRIIHHARHVYVRVEAHCCELLQLTCESEFMIYWSRMRVKMINST